MNTITIAEFLAQEKRGTLPPVIDVRQLEEWNDGHIDGALHIPMGEIGAKIASVIPDLQQEFIVYCASGGRSRRVVDALVQAGYTHARNLEGGFFVYQMHTL